LDGIEVFKNDPSPILDKVSSVVLKIDSEDVEK
jgi:hypothetical protein